MTRTEGRTASIPFQWEIIPGIAKPLPAIAVPSRPEMPKLSLPPYLTSPSQSPMRSPAKLFRAASMSPSTRQNRHNIPHSPTMAYRDAFAVPAEAHASQKCFPVLRRKDGRKAAGGICTASSDDVCSRRSVSARHSFTVPPSFEKNDRFRESEVEVVTRWLF